jgi:hypothetical protein
LREPVIKQVANPRRMPKSTKPSQGRRLPSQFPGIPTVAFAEDRALLEEMSGRAGMYRRADNAVFLNARHSKYLEDLDEAQDLARDQGDGLPVSAQTLRKRLKEKGLLVTTDEHRQKLTVRKTFQGTRRDVLHLSADCLTSPSETGPTGPQAGNVPENGPVLRAGFLATNGEPAHKLAQTTGQDDELGRLGRFETGREAGPGENGAPKRRGSL